MQETSTNFSSNESYTKMPESHQRSNPIEVDGITTPGGAIRK